MLSLANWRLDSWNDFGSNLEPLGHGIRATTWAGVSSFVFHFLDRLLLCHARICFAEFGDSEMEPLYPQILVRQIEFLFLEGAVLGRQRGAEVDEVSYHESQSLGKVFLLPNVIQLAPTVVVLE